MREDPALFAPVNLVLGPGDDLEAAVQQPTRFVRPDAQFGRPAGSGLLPIELDALVGAGEAVPLDQTLMHTVPWISLSARSVTSISGATSVTTHARVPWLPLPRGVPGGACEERYLRTVCRCRPASRAISGTLIALDARRGRKRRKRSPVPPSRIPAMLISPRAPAPP